MKKPRKPNQIRRTYAISHEWSDSEWAQLRSVYARLPEFRGYDQNECPMWYGREEGGKEYLWASVEPCGLFVEGVLEAGKWQQWEAAFTLEASRVLGRGMKNGMMVRPKEAMLTCHQCQSRDVHPVGRKHFLHALKHPACWVFFFPAMPLLLAQSPTLYRCAQCEAAFLKRSKMAWFCHFLLWGVILMYAWLVGMIILSRFGR